MALIRLIITIIVIYFGFKLINSLIGAMGKDSRDRKNPGTIREDLVEDLNCHTYVPASNAYVSEFNGGKMYFCSKQCSDDFIMRQSKISDEGVL